MGSGKGTTRIGSGHQLPSVHVQTTVMASRQRLMLQLPSESMAIDSSPPENGFFRKQSNTPSCSTLSWLSEPLISTTLVSGHWPFTTRANSTPHIIGTTASASIQSNLPRLNNPSASTPSSAVFTACPASVSSSLNTARIALLSSTTRMFATAFCGHSEISGFI